MEFLKHKKCQENTDGRDRSYRDTITTEINPSSLIPRHTHLQKNKDKSWEYRDYSEFDENFICISKDGTLGRIFKVGDLLIGLPDEKGKDIVNNSLNNDISKWKRTNIPDEFLELERNYKRDMNRTKGYKRNTIKEEYSSNKLIYENKYEGFIDREFDKRDYGFFIKIDNEVIYLTGENYMFLNYYYLAEDKIYPDFRVTATHTWWHWEACVADRRAWGELRLKSRRVAWTVEACSIALNGFTRTKYAEIPIVSEGKTLSKTLFTKKIVNPFKYYPTYFKPRLDDPNDLAKGSLEIVHETDQRETSSITPYPTKLTAYDSTKASPFGINDEIGKLEDINISEFRQKHKDCYHKGLGQIVSTGKWGSTAGAFKSGGEGFQYEFESADASKRDKLGKTITGLVALFVDDCYTTAGMFDEWGYPIVFDPKEPIKCDNLDNPITEYGSITQWEVEAEKHKKGKKSEHNAFLREHPRTPEHAFRNEGGIHNDFDIENLNNHEDHLNQLTEHDLTGIVYQGNLGWVGEPFKSNVQWLPNTKGKIFTTWIPEPEMQNKSSLKDFHGKKLIMPDHNHVGVFGIDSYDISKTVDGKGSNGAIIGYSKFNMTGAPTQSFFLKYVDRPDKATDFYEVAMMICKFYGMYALIENNKPRILEHFKDKGFRGYSMTRPDKKWKDLSDFEKDCGGIPSSKQGNSDQANLWKDYIVDFVGQNLDYDCKIYFVDMIKELVKFDVNKRKEFDMTVAGGLALLGSQYNPKMRNPLTTNSSGGLSLSDFGA